MMVMIMMMMVVMVMMLMMMVMLMMMLMMMMVVMMMMLMMVMVMLVVVMMMILNDGVGAIIFFCFMFLFSLLFFLAGTFAFCSRADACFCAVSCISIFFFAGAVSGGFGGFPHVRLREAFPIGVQVRGVGTGELCRFALRFFFGFPK